MKQSQKIISNTVCNGIGYVWILGVSIILTPYIFNKLGAEKFGILVIAEVITNYSGLLDISGIGGAFVKFIAEYNAKKDYKTLNQIVNMGFTYYFSFWIVIFVFVIALKEPLLGIFKFSPDLYNEAVFTLTGVMFIAIIRGGLSVFRSILLGLQRMDITNAIEIVISIPKAIGVVLFLSLGFGLKGLVINSIIIALLTMTAQVVWAYKLLPHIALKPFNFTRDIFSRCFFYGIKIQAARFSELINTQVDKILLGHFLNVGVVGFYELGAKIANMARALPSQLLPAILPASSELDALEDKKKLNQLYYRGTKYLSLLVFPITLFLLFNASSLITLWMGKPGFEKSAVTIQILSIGFTFTLIVSMGRLIARGIGIPQYEMQSSILIAILNISLSAALIIKIGFIGALIGTSVSAITGSLYFIIFFHRHIKESFYQLAIKIYLPPFIASIAASVSFPLINQFFLWVDFFPDNRTDYFFSLTFRGCVFLSLYLLFLFKIKYLDKSDKELFARTVQFFKTALPERN